MLESIKKFRVFCLLFAVSLSFVFGLESAVMAQDSEETQVSSTDTEQSDFVVQDGRLVKYDGTSESVIIPEEVEIIGDYVFSGHSEINQIKLPSNLLRVGHYAFCGCESISEIEIPDKTEIVEYLAFSNCTKLQKIKIGKSVREMGHMSLWLCTSLKSIEVDEENEVYSSIDGVLYDKNIKTLIKCPAAFEGEFFAPEGIASVCKHAFAGCSKITKVVLGGGLKEIGESAFFSCSLLENIGLSEGVKYIGPYAFSDCVSLDNVSIPSTVKYIGRGAFYGCISLKNIVIKSKSVEIEQYAFKGCDREMNMQICDDSLANNYAKFGKWRPKLIRM